MKYKKINPRERRSGFERDLQKQIDRRKNKSASVVYEPERLTFILEKVYVPDWVVVLSDGITKRYIEAKGRLRREDITKLIAVKKQYPNIDLRLVFMRDNKLGRGYYSDWAAKNGFPYAVGKIPADWLY